MESGREDLKMKMEVRENEGRESGAATCSREVK